MDGRKRRRGTRAICPAFQARCDWRGLHWIRCATRSLYFDARADRDAHYRSYCCMHAQRCAMWRKLNGGTEDEKRNAGDPT